MAPGRNNLIGAVRLAGVVVGIAFAAWSAWALFVGPIIIALVKR